MDMNRRKYLKYILGGGLASAAVLSGVSIKEKETIIGKLPTFIIGNKVTAAGIADFTCDGFNDNVQVQNALDLLPSAVGGKIQMLAGNYVFAGGVSRAINNVTIEGLGRSTYIAWDGLSNLFDLGATDYWHFKNLRLDAGGINFGTATNYILENVWIGARYYEYYVQSRVVDMHTVNPFEQYLIGQYICPAYGMLLNGNFTLTQYRLYAILIGLARDITIDRAASHIETAEAGKDIRLGIYDSVNLYPTNLVSDFGTIPTNAAGTQEIALGANVNLTKGYYYFVMIGDGVLTRTPYLYGVPGQGPPPNSPLGQTLGNFEYIQLGYQINKTVAEFNALPATFPVAATLVNSLPFMGMRPFSLD